MDSGNVGPISAAEGLREIYEIRRALGIDEDQNIAYAELTVDGEMDELVAVSGQDSPLGTVLLPDAPSFETLHVRWDRSYDAEVKLLEAIARQLRQTRFQTVEIRLFSERPPCLSCRAVIAQFRCEFAPPDVGLAVTHGYR